MAKSKKTNTDDIKHNASPEGDLARKDLEDQLKRALADYQNLERRVNEERTLLSQLTSALLIEKFLPVLDNLKSAQNHLKDEGLALVVRQFEDILTSEGVEEIKAEGAEFDPNLHEAAEVVEGGNDNVIVKVIANGYKINDKVIRPARVTVSKKSEPAQAEIQTEGGTVDSI